MKLLKSALLLSSLFLGACVSLNTLDDIRKGYSQIVVGMSEQEVVARLGPPRQRGGGGQASWRVEDDPYNYVELRVVFDTGGIVRNISISRRGRFGSSDLEPASRSGITPAELPVMPEVPDVPSK